MGILVGELVTRRRLVGDRRLSDALAECDARGWDALPLAAAELARLFPELGTTEKAAEGWLANNPLNHLISTIRLWGLLAVTGLAGAAGDDHELWSATELIRGRRLRPCSASAPIASW